jgi:hypothetical protein
MKKIILIAIIGLFLLPTLGIAGFFSPKYYPNFHIPNPPRPTESHQRNEGMSVDMAEETVKQYMEERSTSSYKIGEIEDRGAYYMTEIFGSDGNVKEVLVIDKKTNKIESLT